MAWPEIVGHESVWERLSRSVAQRRLASTFLFVGPAGVGKRTVALRLAQALLCQTTAPDQLTACQTCPSCQQVRALSHPDLVTIEKPADRSFIPIELFIGDREHRMQAGLCHDISLKPYFGHRKVAIIDDADHLNQEGANCLLKTLEEPPDRSLIILIGTSQQQQLPTIRSRCQVVRFSPLTADQVTRLLVDLDWVSDLRQAAQVAARADGSLQQAQALLDEDLEQARNELLLPFSQAEMNSLSLAHDINRFVDAAGKDTPARRHRLRQLLRALLSCYRHTMRELAGATGPRDTTTDQFVQQARLTFQVGATTVLPCLERCWEAIRQVDAHANLPTLIAAWVDDLSQSTLQAAGQTDRR
jgi:DNA polymerase III subunit delta'